MNIFLQQTFMEIGLFCSAFFIIILAYFVISYVEFKIKKINEKYFNKTKAKKHINKAINYLERENLNDIVEKLTKIQEEI